jgi:2,3-bisphosphoglycerate-dependent phosphoglycerate mutase
MTTTRERSTLVLVRHGQSEWNEQDLFTGWYDADLTETGVAEARAGGQAMADAGLLPDVVHTSLQTRAIRTANLALDELDRLWIPVRRSWRLNERHYGDLQGKNKKQTVAEHGAEQVQVWRRSYATPPPPIADDNEFSQVGDARYADLPPELVPRTECLADVVARVLPYWYDDVVPDLAAGSVVMIAAHGNSLRALVKHLDAISDDDIAGLNLPTGVPLVYELGADLRPVEAKPVLERALGDLDAVRAAAEAVANQTKADPDAEEEGDETAEPDDPAASA